MQYLGGCLGERVGAGECVVLGAAECCFDVHGTDDDARSDPVGDTMENCPEDRDDIIGGSAGFESVGSDIAVGRLYTSAEWSPRLVIPFARVCQAGDPEELLQGV